MLVPDKNSDLCPVFVDYEVAQIWASDESVASDGTSLYHWATDLNHWRKLPEIDAESLAYSVLRKIFETQVAPQLATVKHARISVQSAKLFLMGVNPMRDQSSEKIIPCQNGYLHLDGRTLNCAVPKMYLQYALTCDYVSEAKALQFEQYIRSVLPDLTVRNRVQEFIGSLLLSENFGIHQLWVGRGAGPLGKIIRTFSGDAAMSTTDTLDQFRLSALLIEVEGYQNSKNTAGISKAVQDALVNKSTAPNSRFSTPSALSVAGKLIVISEQAPSISDPSESYWRRWDVVAFLESQDVSKTVIATELSGVLNWALDGLERLLERKCFGDRPAAVNCLLPQTKSGSSSVHAWVEDSQVRVVAISATRKDSVYRAYCQWCDSHSVDALAVTTFWARTRQVFPGLIIRKKVIDGEEIRHANLQFGALALISSA